ncbi:unnamed protein product [Diplocarpon coronariae]
MGCIRAVPEGGEQCAVVLSRPHVLARETPQPLSLSPSLSPSPPPPDSETPRPPGSVPLDGRVESLSRERGVLTPSWSARASGGPSRVALALALAQVQVQAQVLALALASSPEAPPRQWSPAKGQRSITSARRGGRDPLVLVLVLVLVLEEEKRKRKRKKKKKKKKKRKKKKKKKKRSSLYRVGSWYMGGIEGGAAAVKRGGDGDGEGDRSSGACARVMTPDSQPGPAVSGRQGTPAADRRDQGQRRVLPLFMSQTARAPNGNPATRDGARACKSFDSSSPPHRPLIYVPSAPDDALPF